MDMQTLKLTALLGVALLASPVQAEEKMLEMAVKNGCFVCHTLQHKSGPAIPLAPPYADIAERYHGDQEAPGYLAERILKGTVESKQNWEGKVNMRFMPPNVSVSPEEARLLAEWILGLKKDAVSEEFVTYEGMLALAAQNGCIACHGVSKEQDSHYIPLAPTFQEIAARYKSTENASTNLVESILNGTVGKEKSWPDVNMLFMPANTALSKEDAATLAQWILTLDGQ